MLDNVEHSAGNFTWNDLKLAHMIQRIGLFLNYMADDVPYKQPENRSLSLPSSWLRIRVMLFLSIIEIVLPSVVNQLCCRIISLLIAFT
jgi:hypothetical protein